MPLKKGLGKGLDALLGDYTAVSSSSILEMDVNLIDNNQDQPRKTFDEGKLNELASSIKRYGMMQPIIVRENNGRYTIVAGERRYRAARLAGMDTVPIVVKEFSDVEVMEVALIENIQREDLNPIEEAAAIRFLMQQHDLTQEEVSQRLSRSRPAIANSLRLLNLPERVQDLLREGKLQSGHARAILSVEGEEARVSLAERIAGRSLSVRQAEDLAREASGRKKRKAKQPKPEAAEEAEAVVEAEDTAPQAAQAAQQAAQAAQGNQPKRREDYDKYFKHYDYGYKGKDPKYDPYDRHMANYDPDMRSAEEAVRQKLGTKVSIIGTMNKGKVVIEYYNREMLSGIYDILMFN